MSEKENSYPEILKRLNEIGEGGISAADRVKKAQITINMGDGEELVIPAFDNINQWAHIAQLAPQNTKAQRMLDIRDQIIRLHGGATNVSDNQSTELTQAEIDRLQSKKGHQVHGTR